MRLPTGIEINAAREYVDWNAARRLEARMDKWQGETWHKSEIAFGILIGLEIARVWQRKEAEK